MRSRFVIGYCCLLAAAFVALITVMVHAQPSPTLSLMTLGYATGAEAAMPAACPSKGLIFYVTTDTTPVHLWWCFDATPWRRVLNDVPLLPAVAAKPVTIGALQADGTCSPRLPIFSPSFVTAIAPGDIGADWVQAPWTPCVLP